MFLGMKIRNVVLGISFFVLLLSPIAYFLVVSSFYPKIEESGLFGDTFGALTSFYTVLAFLGMIITLYMQREELKLQRQELKDTKLEIARSATAQENTFQISLLSSKVSALDSLITSWRERHKRMPKEFDAVVLDNKIAGLEDQQFQLLNELDELILTARLDATKT